MRPDRANPFALVKAADYSDRQINELWVELGQQAIDAIIEPHAQVSKFILGSKGSGKTHLLRYHSYPVARLRYHSQSGLQVVDRTKFIATFLRTTGMDAARFELDENPKKWQQLFGVYLELRLAEGLLESLADIQRTSPDFNFDDARLIQLLNESLVGTSLLHMRELKDLLSWVSLERRGIDDAINQAAFTGDLQIRIPFSLGALLFRLCEIIGDWCHALEKTPLLFLLDEIENFSMRQQQVVNTLIRYGGGFATFRVSGRLYAVKTHATIADGEENREGSEFTTTNLDELLRTYTKFPKFARQFLTKRLDAAGVVSAIAPSSTDKSFEIAHCFEEFNPNAFYAEATERWQLAQSAQDSIRAFANALRGADITDHKRECDIDEICAVLTNGLPPVLQKLNILLFCKKTRPTGSLLVLARTIRKDAQAFFEDRSRKGAYATAYGHYSSDLMAQLSRGAAKAPDAIYAGFDTFVRMACGNPRNLLILLGRIHAIASFRGIPFSEAKKVNIETQTEGAEEAARFLFDSDSNYGSPTDAAKEAVTRLASLLKAARFSLNIPEVSPLAVSFNEAHLTDEAKQILRSSLNWSFVFEIFDGRPDRNRKDQRNLKIQLNPLLSPHWSLPTGVRGDLSLSPEMANSIFSPKARSEFEVLLKTSLSKWNQPFKPVRSDPIEQKALF
jgi:hypothetical protein